MARTKGRTRKTRSAAYSRTSAQ